MISGYDFDLSQLKKDTGYSLDDHKGHQFLINICAAPKDSPCGATAGTYCKLGIQGCSFGNIEEISNVFNCKLSVRALPVKHNA